METIFICMRLKKVSDPFDAGQFVELHFSIPSCGQISGGGELTARINATDVGKWMLGDEYHIRIQRT